jgi:hypothetical protein
MFPFIPHGREITLEAAAILFGAREEDGDDWPRVEACPCPEPRRDATRKIEIRHCDNDRRDADIVLCRASEEWPELYAGVFTAGIVLGGRRKHAEIDIRFCEAACGIGPVFLLCRYTTGECASPHPEMFNDPISWTDRPASLYRPRRLWGDRESERNLAIEGYPMGGRQIPRR